MIPDKLFRGDDDQQNISQLRYSSSRQHFHSNLIKGGSGIVIFTEPLLNLVNIHVLSKFDSSHFLSFTESRNVAMRYGLKLMSEKKHIIEAGSVPQFDNDEEWDFALLTITY